MIAAIDYLIVAMDYATTCAGICPTCVLSKVERAVSTPASTLAAIEAGMKSSGAAYEKAGTLAVTIGRANVLALPETSIDEIVTIMRFARENYRFDHILAEISTSLIGKIDLQIERAKRITQALNAEGIESRFVVVANTALHSDKYWANLDRFLTEMEDLRGGREEQKNGDILQLALAIDSLPEPEELVARFSGYGFPINLAWAPSHDCGAQDIEGLARLEDWLAQFYDLSIRFGLDSSIVFRIDNAVRRNITDLMEAVKNAERSSEAVVYIDQDGNWHNGLFTALAEMDPVRFDRLAEGRTMAGTSAREIRKIITNPACSSCPYIGPCVSAGGHKIGLIALRNHNGGTTVCPSGLRKTFERSQQRIANVERANA
jgi:hypothetical protein